MNPDLDAQHVLWYPRDMVARMEWERAQAARLLLRDIDKTGRDGDRWFLAGALLAFPAVWVSFEYLFTIVSPHGTKP